jgi:1-acyl-sn-glycerol-3-phosphate acyltransferase
MREKKKDLNRTVKRIKTGMTRVRVRLRLGLRVRVIVRVSVRGESNA